MRIKAVALLCLVVVFGLAWAGSAMANGGLVTSTTCSIDGCHTHPGYTDFSTWHASHQASMLCEGCHPNNHTSTGPPSAPEATYTLAEACNPCHMASTAASTHAAEGITSCVDCHPSAGTLSGTVSGPSVPPVGVSVTVAGMQSALTYADGS